MAVTQSSTRRQPSLPRIVLMALVVGVASLALAVSASAATLKGTIQLTTGATSGPTPYAGSWVQLYETANPSVYFTNPSSPAANQTYTPLVNGTEGVDLGLPVQGEATPAFDAKGNSLTNTILTPEPFAGTNFSSFVTLNSAKKAKYGKKGIVIKVGGGKGATVAVTSADLTGWTIAYGAVSSSTRRDPPPALPAATSQGPSRGPTRKTRAWVARSPWIGACRSSTRRVTRSTRTPPIGSCRAPTFRLSSAGA